MFNLFLFISGSEIFIILLVVLLLFGANKIPEIARGLGKGYHEFKKATQDIKNEFNEQTQDIKNEVNDIKSNLNDDFNFDDIEKEDNPKKDEDENSEGSNQDSPDDPYKNNTHDAK